MESILLIILIGLAGGVAVGLQGPLASMISQRLGTFESVFIVHVGGALIALLPLLFASGGKLAQWKELPWYWYGFDSFLFAAAMALLVPGALAFVFGWFAFGDTRTRLVGLARIMTRGGWRWRWPASPVLVPAAAPSCWRAASSRGSAS